MSQRHIGQRGDVGTLGDRGWDWRLDDSRVGRLTLRLPSEHTRVLGVLLILLNHLSPQYLERFTDTNVLLGTCLHILNIVFGCQLLPFFLSNLTVFRWAVDLVANDYPADILGSMLLYLIHPRLDVIETLSICDRENLCTNPLTRIIPADPL